MTTYAHTTRFQLQRGASAERKGTARGALGHDHAFCLFAHLYPPTISTVLPLLVATVFGFTPTVNLDSMLAVQVFAVAVTVLALPVAVLGIVLSLREERRTEREAADAELMRRFLAGRGGE